jgi:hypothetical protein
MTTETSPRTAGVMVARTALLFGVAGLVLGLVRGLTVYAPTAWAAMFEVGIPFAVVGVTVGFVIVGVRRFRRRFAPRAHLHH